MYTDYFETEPPAGWTIVRSSFGELLVDSVSGLPSELRCSETHGSPWGMWSADGSVAINAGDKLPPDEDNYLKDIARFNVEEWRRFYTTSNLPPVLDICDLGHWNVDGSYEEAMSTWRSDNCRYAAL